MWRLGDNKGNDKKVSKRGCNPNAQAVLFLLYLEIIFSDVRKAYLIAKALSVFLITKKNLLKTLFELFCTSKFVPTSTVRSPLCPSRSFLPQCKEISGLKQSPSAIIPSSAERKLEEQMSTKAPVVIQASHHHSWKQNRRFFPKFLWIPSIPISSGLGSKPEHVWLVTVLDDRFRILWWLKSLVLGQTCIDIYVCTVPYHHCSIISASSCNLQT